MIYNNKSKPQLVRILAKWFNEFIRTRDKGFRCISCGVRPVSDAGHFWPTSQYPQPSMRFNEKNVNGQCVQCNRFQEGARQGYEKGLIKKYGAGVIQELDICRSLKQNPWQKFEYIAMIQHYKEKLKKIK